MSEKLPPRILIIEPENDKNTNTNTIDKYYFAVNRARSFDAAVKSARLNPPNFIIISSRMRDRPASEIIVRLKRLKNLNQVPVIFLIEEHEKPVNYERIGGDYFTVLQRPYTATDLMLAIKSLLRKAPINLADKIIKYRDIKMNLSNYQIFRGNRELNLGPTGFKMLQLFMQNPGTIYSRDQIIEAIWGENNDIVHRTIDVHINRIRKLMKNEPKEHHIIKTIRANGYYIDPDGK